MPVPTLTSMLGCLTMPACRACLLAGQLYTAAPTCSLPQPVASAALVPAHPLARTHTVCRRRAWRI